jgi:hypothetical protein
MENGIRLLAMFLGSELDTRTAVLDATTRIATAGYKMTVARRLAAVIRLQPLPSKQLSSSDSTPETMDVLEARVPKRHMIQEIISGKGFTR